MLETTVIEQTSKWIKSVVIGCNFCPFAAKALLLNRIRFVVLPDAGVESTLEKLLEEMRYLDRTPGIETTLIILPDAFGDFEAYLDLVDEADGLVEDEDYEGVYQVASFHPEYCFEGAEQDDPANYTNRSIYPMLHILREDSVTDAVDNFPDAEGIPERNVGFAQRKGLAYMEALRKACL